MTESPLELDNRPTLTYPGDVRQGDLWGRAIPNGYGELLTADEMHYDGLHDVTYVKFRYATTADA
jgi:hypothetical protein